MDRPPLSLCLKHRDEAGRSPAPRADCESVPTAVLAPILLAIASKQ